MKEGELSARELNKVIVNMRPVVRAAMVRITRKLISQLRRVKDAKSEKKKRRVERYEKEISAIKKLTKDDVTKFALVNTKSLNDFKYTNSTPEGEVALYKVSTEKSMVEAVDKVRETYPNWHQEIPFYLQRFGTKPKSKKKPTSKGNRKTQQKGQEAESNSMNDTIQDKEAMPKRPEGKPASRMKRVTSDERSQSMARPKKNTTDPKLQEDSQLHPSWRLKREQAEKEKLLMTRLSKRVHKKFD